jgi:hypothetical protein
MAGEPQYFAVISSITKYIIDQQLTADPAVNSDEMLLAIHDFMAGQPVLEEGSIYLTKLKGDSILLETHGATIFAEAFSGEVDRPHYKGFHRAVKYLMANFKGLELWNGAPGSLPEHIRGAIGRHFHGGVQPEMAAPPAGPVMPPTPPEPVAGAPAARPLDHEPDIVDCERMLKEWHRKGYNIDPLKEAQHTEWSNLVATVLEYRRNVTRLEALQDRVRQLIVPGFEKDVERLNALLQDPSRIGELEDGVEALVRKIKDRLAITLPVTDRDALVAGMNKLPFGIPSALWGVGLDNLVQELLLAERGLVPDGTVVVKLRAVWYHADPRNEKFMTSYSGPVRTQELSRKDGKSDPLDELVKQLLDKK